MGVEQGGFDGWMGACLEGFGGAGGEEADGGFVVRGVGGVI